MYDLVDISIVNSFSDVLEFFFPVIALVEPRVSDGIYVDMLRDLGRWFPIMIIVTIHIFGKEGYCSVDRSMDLSRESV